MKKLIKTLTSSFGTSGTIVALLSLFTMCVWVVVCVVWGGGGLQLTERLQDYTGGRNQVRPVTTLSLCSPTTSYPLAITSYLSDITSYGRPITSYCSVITCYLSARIS